jgi:predicted enzyme related to lactoylglutathione lyase
MADERRRAGLVTPRFTLTAAVLDTPDPQGLARFYQQLLGWPLGTDDPEWATLRPEDGGAGLSFQREEDHVPPVWPAGPGDPRMQLHVDIEVDDLAAAVEVAVCAGAVVAEFQPQGDVRVCLDPAGHPFCLWVRE